MSSHHKKTVFVAVAAVTALVLMVAGLFLFSRSEQPSQPKAAIIDQLSSSELSPSSQHKNETFVNEAEELLYERFPQIDYYSDNATVDQYARLSEMGYKLIVWRAHSALDPDNYTAISSSERYQPGKYDEYSEDQVKLCNITGDPYLYYAITPYFIKECMSGSFRDTVIVFMSCNGLKQGYYKTGEAFMEKGAKVFISWDGWIDPSDNDEAAALLLRCLIDKNETIGEAVNGIPMYSSVFGLAKMSYYPGTSDIANYHIPDYRQNSVTNSMQFALTETRRRGQKILHLNRVKLA